MHKGNNCKTWGIPAGDKYLIQCSVCSCHGKSRLFSSVLSLISKSGRGGEWWRPGSRTKWIPQHPYGIKAPGTGILMYRWSWLNMQVFVHDLLIRFCLLGVKASLVITLILDWFSFFLPWRGLWALLLFRRRKLLFPSPHSHRQPIEFEESPAERRPGLNCFDYYSWPEGKMYSFLNMILLKFFFSGFPCLSVFQSNGPRLGCELRGMGLRATPPLSRVKQWEAGGCRSVFNLKGPLASSV